MFPDRYCVSGRHCHLEGPVRSVQEAQREMRDEEEINNHEKETEWKC